MSRRRMFAAGAFALSTTFIAIDARADEDTNATRSYAWQTLSVDAAAVAVIGTGLATSGFESWSHTTLYSRAALDRRDHGDVGNASLVTTDVGALLFIGGAPIVHALHGRGTSAALSLGLRAVAPSAGLLLFGLIGIIPSWIGGDCHMLPSETCTNERARLTIAHAFAGVGIAAGYAGASVVDALALTKEPAKAHSAPSTGLRWIPRLGLVAGGGGTVGIDGAF